MQTYEAIHINSCEKRIAKVIHKKNLKEVKEINVIAELGKYMRIVSKN